MPRAESREHVDAARDALAADRPLDAIAHALLSIAGDVRTLREDVRDIRRQAARR
jgi:hypothetical protein